MQYYVGYFYQLYNNIKILVNLQELVNLKMHLKEMVLWLLLLL